MKMDKKFTSAQLENIYDIVKDFGGDRKVELKLKIQSLMLKDRRLIKYKNEITEIITKNKNQ